MKEEIKRIMKLVQEGKLSPDDAAELIDAFSASEDHDGPTQEAAPEEPKAQAGETPPPPPPEAGGSKDPFKQFVEYMEGLGREVGDINWQDVAGQVRAGAKKGVDAIKQTVDQVKEGKIHLGWLAAQETKEVSLPLILPTGKTLRIENPAGDVRVTGGSEAPTVNAKVSVRGADSEDAKRKADEYTLIVEESDHVVLIRQPSVSGLTVDLSIQVGKAQMVEVSSETGDVTIHDTGGGAKASTRAGNVRVRGLTGPVDITALTGDVSADDCPSSLMSIENKSGDIRVVGSKGNLSLRAASGDILVKDCSGKSLSVESVTGDVNIELTEPITGAVNVRTVNGDARVAVPDNCDCRVSLSTLRGDVECAMLLQDEARTAQRVTGRVGAGTGTLDVSAVNGDIWFGLRPATTAV